MSGHVHRWGPWLTGDQGERRFCQSLRCGAVQYATEVTR